jgi:hypothetical protein
LELAIARLDGNPRTARQQNKSHENLLRPKAGRMRFNRP